MSPLGITLVLGLLVLGTWAQLMPTVRPPCDSPEAEAAALVAQDYLNAQHTHGYKYRLNQIDDFKILTMPGGGEHYFMELDLLETYCHVLDPTPVANCSVRPKALTSVEADCDVVLTKTGEVLSVTAFKCKTEESTEDICLGCPSLLPLNDTAGLAMVSASIDTFNNNKIGNASLFAIMEVGRMATQIVSGGTTYILAEYAIVETNCTAIDSDNCVPLNHTLAQYGFCQVKGLPVKSNILTAMQGEDGSLSCSIFTTPMGNGTVAVPPPVVHVHTGNLPVIDGLRHHKLTSLHDPSASDLVSAESAESEEDVVPVVPVVPVEAVGTVVPVEAVGTVVPVEAVGTVVPVEAVGTVVPVEAVGTEAPVLTVVKRQAPAADAAAIDSPAIQPVVMPLEPVCPGKVKFFS